MKPLKNILKVLTVFFLGLIILQCKKKENNTAAAQTQFTVMTNASDPQLLSATTPHGDVIDLYGERAENGLPLKIDQMVITNKTNEEQTFLLDSLLRPTDIFAHNGVRFHLDWLSAHAFALTAYSNDGETQINTFVDLQQSLGKRSTQASAKRRSGKLKLDFKVPPALAKKSSTAGKCNLYLTQCDIPADAYAWVSVMANLGNFNRHIPAKKISTGHYQVSIPNNIAGSVNTAEICGKIASMAGLLCDITQAGTGGLALATAMCVRLSGAAGAVSGGTATAPVMIACEAVAAGLVLYCNTLGGSAAPGAPSLASQLCNASFLNTNFTENIELRGVIAGLPNNLYSTVFTVDPDGPYPDIHMNIGSVPGISGFVLEPSAPVAGQEYQAVSEAFCLPLAARVTLSISGTDGYDDSVTYFVSQPEKFGKFVLTVPGAESGIEDVCTVTIELPDGKKLKRTASLVFN